MEVVKVQLSLFSSEGHPKALIYNKDKSVWWEGIAADELIKKMGGRVKMFFKARIEKDNSLSLIKPVKQRNW